MPPQPQWHLMPASMVGLWCRLPLPFPMAGLENGMEDAPEAYAPAGVDVAAAVVADRGFDWRLLLLLPAQHHHLLPRYDNRNQLLLWLLLLLKS